MRSDPATGASRSWPFAEGYGEHPSWLDDVPPLAGATRVLPQRADVVIVGSGYTGLSAAIETARGGLSTVVLEAGDPGQGCSTRNGGQISTSVKPSLADLTRRVGAERARAIRMEGVTALDWIEAFVAREGIDCDFERRGRFFAAHTPDAFDRLARTAERTAAEEGIEARVVRRPDQRTELGTDFYHGGVVYPRHAALHPAKFHRGLLAAAEASGATVIGNCPAVAISRAGAAFTVETARGPIRAEQVVVATNGYTSRLTPWLRRRVIPIGSYVIATEPLPDDLADRLFPSGRTACDTRRVVYYYRLSPDRRRVVFGGRVSAGETDPAVSGPRLHAEMSRIFPELKGVRISHSWGGTVAYSFDELAHTGVHEGIHYAMGYCGSGVSMASYLGMRTGRRVLDHPDGRTAFDDLPFPTRPLYDGQPWFLPAAVAWYRWRDRIDCARAANSAGRVSAAS